LGPVDVDIFLLNYGETGVDALHSLGELFMGDRP
jgi:hypothetical protein